MLFTESVVWEDTLKTATQIYLLAMSCMFHGILKHMRVTSKKQK